MDRQPQPPDAAGPFAPAQRPTPPPPPMPPPESQGYPGYPGYPYGYPLYYPPPIAQPYLAGFWWRFLAAQIIDATFVANIAGLLLMPASLFLFVGNVSRIMKSGSASGPHTYAAYPDVLPLQIGIVLLSIVLGVVYDGLLIGRWHGQTIGKSAGVRACGDETRFGASVRTRLPLDLVGPEQADVARQSCAHARPQGIGAASGGVWRGRA